MTSAQEQVRRSSWALRRVGRGLITYINIVKGVLTLILGRWLSEKNDLYPRDSWLLCFWQDKNNNMESNYHWTVHVKMMLYLIDVSDWFKWFKICGCSGILASFYRAWITDTALNHLKQRGEHVEENTVFGGKYTPGHLAHGSSD